MRARLALAALSLASLLPACARSEERARWIELRAPIPEPAALPDPELGGPRCRWVERDGGAWLAFDVARELWRPTEGGAWRCVLPVIAAGRPTDESPGFRFELEDGRSLPFLPREAHLEAGVGESFSVVGKNLFLRLPEGAEPPETCTALIGANHVIDDGGEVRVVGRTISGHGLRLLPGRAEALRVDVPTGSRLSFATAVERLAPDLPSRPGTFRVRSAGRTLFEHAVTPGGDAVLDWHAVGLEGVDGGEAVLEFSWDGPFALASVLGPVVRPGEIGSYGDRPGGAARPPDLVFFVADTLRADLLGAYGSTRGLTPAIDRFAGEARVFRNSWSTATHTLPSHAAMFTGAFPPQNGIVSFYTPLPAEVRTLAELLGEAGYRCGAITDGVMMSMSHGIDQGFEYFDERVDVPTLQRVRDFVAADDGRPLFLFVQTYAVHSPYHPSAEARARAGVPPDLDYDAVFGELLELGWRDGDEVPASARGIVERMRVLYEAQTFDLDTLFAALRADLEARGLWDAALVLFTSDHGEAFCEHDAIFHTGVPFEEQLRVPLILRGPGIEPGVETTPVSLIDLAPTLAELTGLPRLDRWRGLSLLAPDPGRTIYAFQSKWKTRSVMAVLSGGRKVLVHEEPDAVRDAEVVGAYDLSSDPGETRDVAGAEAWPGNLLEAERERLLRYLTAEFEGREVGLSAEKLREMAAMGYGGEE